VAAMNRFIDISRVSRGVNEEVRAEKMRKQVP